MKRRVLIVCIFIAICIAFIYISFNTPFSFQCWVKYMTGLECPTCGLTRGVISLCHLEFYQAFRYNCLMVPLFPLFLIILVISIVQYIKNTPLENTILIKIFTDWYIPIIIIMVLWGILRNVFPFLAPTVIA